MTRPIKKARVTRRRKYYGGGKRRGGTTLKKVGGGNKTRQIKRCRGSNNGGHEKKSWGVGWGEFGLKVTDNRIPMTPSGKKRNEKTCEALQEFVNSDEHQKL